MSVGIRIQCYLPLQQCPGIGHEVALVWRVGRVVEQAERLDNERCAQNERDNQSFQPRGNSDLSPLRYIEGVNVWQEARLCLHQSLFLTPSPPYPLHYPHISYTLPPLSTLPGSQSRPTSIHD